MSNIPVIDIVQTGKNITILRKKAGLSVKDLQNILGFSTGQAIYNWQRGIALPSLDNLVILSTLFQVKLDDIIITKI